MFQNVFSRKGFAGSAITVAYFMLTTVAGAQLDTTEAGFEWGPLFIRPEFDASVSYDNRVLRTPTVEGDAYGEVAAGVRLNNRPARYKFSALGRYGYRTYSEYSKLDDDFYRANAALGTDEGRFNWKLATDYRKMLDYDATYNPYSGEGPDSILTDQPNTRSETRGTASYGIPLSERTSLEPEYGLWHYYQEFVGDNTEEWQVHRVRVPVKYAWTDKTMVSAGAGMNYQVNKAEEGYVGTVYAGAESRATDKTTYSLYAGFSVADYELSGQDYGVVSDARIIWDVTEKVMTYVFGGNRFQPGYGGQPARMVYRAGYGATWKMSSQWSLGGQGLHDYQVGLGQNSSNNDYGDVQSFFNARLGYKLPRWAELALTGKYVIDQYEENQVVVSVRIIFRF